MAARISERIIITVLCGNHTSHIFIMFRQIHQLGRHLTSFRALSSSRNSQLLAKTSLPIWADRQATTGGKPARTKDFEDIIDVESNLFDNSRLQSRPVDSKELLAKFSKIPPKRRGGGSGSQPNKFRSAKPATPAVAENKQRAPKVKSEIVQSTILGLTYTKLHLNDPWLNTLLLSVKSRKSRAIKHQLLVEGRRLIIEAIESGLVLDHVLFSDMDQMQLLKEHLPSDAKLVKVPQSDLRVWSNLSTCPGLMAVFTKPNDMSDIWTRRQSAPLPITVICDQVREPNNVGSIIRNCAAIAVEQVIVTKGCADPWESKALRGGSGGQFKIPVRGPCEWSSIRSMLPRENCFVFLAENCRANALEHLPDGPELIVPYSDVAYAGKHAVIVIGGETEGISEDAYRLLSRNVLGQCIHIPLAAEVESLNSAAALAVILFEIKKQMLAANV